MPDHTQIIFRVTWDENPYLPEPEHFELVTERLTDYQTLMMNLMACPHLYLNVKRYASKIEWREV